MSGVISRARVWLKRLLGGGVVIIVLGSIAGAVYEQAARRRAARDFPPEGVLLEVDGRVSHIDCEGEGSPTVVLEAGADVGGSYAWATVHSGIAAISRTCSYDRAGMLWSDLK